MASILDDLVASVRGLGTRVRTYAQTAPVNLTAETAKVGGETETNVRGKMQPSHVGLGALVNAAPATPAEVSARTPQVYATRKDAGQIWAEETGHVKGKPGDNFFVGPDKVITGLLPGASLEFVNVVTNDAELNEAKAAEESMKTVFQTWRRISKGNWKATPEEKLALGYSDDAIPEDLAAFTYNESTGNIENPRDTYSMVGFLSNRPYSDYTLDVVLRSDSIWQNDPMGLLIGYARDAQGNTHTLTVMCHPYQGGYGYPEPSPWPGFWPVSVVVDFNVPGQKTIKGSGKGLKWVTGSPGDQTMTGATGDVWAIKPWVQALNGWRLKITRVGDVFTIETSGYDVPTLTPAATFTLDLNEHPELAQFKGAQPYGYVAISQDMAIWDVKQRPGARQAIVDIRSNTLWQWDGTAWVANPGGGSMLILPNRFYYNSISRKLFYAETQDLLLNIL